MMHDNGTYTGPDARRVSRLAKSQDFQNEDGSPDIMKLSTATRVGPETCKFILGQPSKFDPKDESQEPAEGNTTPPRGQRGK